MNDQGRRRVASAYVALLLTALLPACRESSSGIDPAPASFLRAAVAGATSDTYEGSGEFATTSAPTLGGPRAFVVTSEALDGRGDRRFMLWQYGAGLRLATGSHDVAVPDYSRDAWRSVAVVYIRVIDNAVEVYVGRAGEIVITESSARRIAGTFRFTGLRYCARGARGSEGPVGSCQPSEVDPGAPTIEVSGSFAAQPSPDAG